MVIRGEDAHIAKSLADIHTCYWQYVHKNTLLFAEIHSLQEPTGAHMTQVSRRSCTLPAETLIFLQNERTVYLLSNSHGNPASTFATFKSAFIFMLQLDLHGVQLLSLNREQSNFLYKLSVLASTASVDTLAKNGVGQPGLPCRTASKSGGYPHRKNRAFRLTADALVK